MKQRILSVFAFLALAFGTAVDVHATTPGLDLITAGSYGTQLNYCGYRLLPVHWDSNQLIVELIGNPAHNNGCDVLGKVMTMSCSGYICTETTRVYGGIRIRELTMISRSSFKESVWTDRGDGLKSNLSEIIYYRY